MSVDAAGVPKVAYVPFGFTITHDGRYAVFYSEATDLVSGDTNNCGDVFLRDRLNGTTERVSLGWTGAQASGTSAGPWVSADGRFVAFASGASNLVAGDTNGVWDIFVRDRQLGTTERVSLSNAGLQADGPSDKPSISSDGRYIAFNSWATNLVAGDTNGRVDGFVRDRVTGATQRISIASNGVQGDGDCEWAVISGDGRFTAFMSTSSNLTAGDSNGLRDIFVRDLQLGTTECVSAGPGGLSADGYSGWPCISDDGRFVAFSSTATDLVQGLPTPTGGVFVHDRLMSTTDVVSTLTGGILGSLGYGQSPSISMDGRFIAFHSLASDLVPGDTNGYGDIFLHDRNPSGFTSVCQPGAGGVIPCPCNNPPVGPGLGCDNSSFTGGALLSATGYAYLSLDSLVFTTLLEKPGATSILLQGTSTVAIGVAFGQGVRCAGGQLKRLYVKTAFNGSITAPELGTGDLPVSARSAQIGLPIQPGQPYVYQVYYRDPTVLGGCSALNTFNVTQAGRVSWWP